MGLQDMYVSVGIPLWLGEECQSSSSQQEHDHHNLRLHYPEQGSYHQRLHSVPFQLVQEIQQHHLLQVKMDYLVLHNKMKRIISHKLKYAFSTFYDALSISPSNRCHQKSADFYILFFMEEVRYLNGIMC